MVHPVAGRNQYPFTINGIIVDGAKINGVTYVKDLFIYKQRSYNMYDLIDSMGVVYEFIEITWTTTEGVDLNYFDNSSFIVNQIRNNTFFIKIQDVPRNIYGFITLMQLNKIKVHTGDYIYYNENDDYSLLSVRCIPATIQARLGETVSIGVQFLPLDFKNQSGSWTAENNIVTEVGRSLTQQASFACMEVGHGRVTFNPSASSVLAATAQIFVTDEAPEYTSFVAMQNDPTGESLENDNTYYPGDEFTYTIVFDPFDYVPPVALEVEVDETALVYLGTDDNINYKFKVPEDATYTGTRTHIFFRDGEIEELGQPIVRLRSSAQRMSITPQTAFGRPGESYQFALAESNQPTDPDYTWSVSDPTIGVVDLSGLLSVTGSGEQKVYANVNGGYELSSSTMTSSPNIPDMYKYYPNDINTFHVGDKIQLSYETVPSTVPATGTWHARGYNNEPYFSISSTGLLTILKEPITSSDVFYVGITYEGGTKYGGAVDNSVQSTTKAFCIAKSGVNYDVTQIILYDDVNRINIPLGGQTKSNVTVHPRNATVSKDWTYEVSKEGIVEVSYDPYYNNNFYQTDIRFKGLSRGQVDITFTSVSNPSVTSTYTLTVY